MENVIEEFKKLLAVSQHLMGPQGCPWDREQTIVSMRGSLLEETYEVLETVDEGDDVHLAEELGDLFYNVLFFCQLGEKEERFTTSEVLLKLREKLIARHPHVFGEKVAKNAKEAIEQWEKIKYEKRESLMDGIPKALPSLARAYKIASKMKNAHYPSPASTAPDFNSEEELGEILWALALKAKEKGLQPEHALRAKVFEQESLFRTWEKHGKEN